MGFVNKYSDVYTLNNTYIVKFDKLTTDTKMVGDLEIKIDTRYHEKHHANDRGIIYATTEEDDIRVGDVALCQYLVVEENNRIDEDGSGYYQLANREQIFAIMREDEVIMLDEYILVKPEEAELGEYEEINGILRPRKEKYGKETIGEVINCGKLVKNVKVGDKVRIHKAATYPIEIDGVRYFRVRSNVGLIYKYKE